MLFNSFTFLLFLIPTFIVYWLLNKYAVKYQNLWVLITSYFFYAWWDWRYLLLISFSATIGYVAGLLMNKEKFKLYSKKICTISILLNISFLAIFKYTPFVVSNLNELFNTFSIQLTIPKPSIILPIAISFYTFHNISYIVDVYRKDIPPTKDIVIYLSFMSYFPQLIAGPIQRAKELIPQFTVKRFFSYKQSVAGLQQVLWGLFKKVIIADSCAIIVNHCFENYNELSSIYLLYGTICFSFQIYGDFSGYTDIALGVSKLFGIELTTNFKTPYLAYSIPDFWRRWHISLTTWFKDYIYIPLGGSKKGLYFTILNTCIIFLISGIWHGANWTYVVWGIINAIYFIPFLFFKVNKPNTFWLEVIMILFTFLLINFSWIFFRANSISDALQYINAIFSNIHLPIHNNFWGISILFPIVILIFIEALYFKEKGVHFLYIPNHYIRWALYLFISFCILMTQSYHQSTEFIYFQF
jgi:D-alanyl-lipoteichoic acid acyltransferase DltB (MBOAT superfamily)